MKRISLILAGALACLLVVSVGTAAAAGGSSTATACSATSRNVIGGKFLVSVEKSNVDPSQKRFASCAYAKKVVYGLTSIRIEKPRSSKPSAARRPW